MITTEKHSISLPRKLRAHIELADPVTWISPSIVCFCGAIASGPLNGFNFGSLRDIGLAALGALMCGPLGTGFSQSINDYFDRDLDAINDPERPIPAGLVTLNEARLNWLVLGAATIMVSLLLGSPWIVLLAVLGIVLSVLYSMPPIKLKQNFWFGPPAVGIGYVSCSWIAGHLIFAPLSWQSFVVALINGGLATGLLFLNDIKSVEGDRRLGMKSLTVAIGVQQTLIIAFATVNFFQISLMVLAFVWGHLWVALFILLALVVPIYSQIKLYQEPTHKNFVRYILSSNPFVALIQFISAFVVGGYFG
jgi:chlorophyll synthase/bacteriochlorophyll c synthase